MTVHNKIKLSLSCYAADSLLDIPLPVCVWWYVYVYMFLSFCLSVFLSSLPEGNNFARTELIQNWGILALPESQVSQRHAAGGITEQVIFSLPQGKIAWLELKSSFRESNFKKYI